MTQLNLLPNIKLEYLKAERARRLVMGISIIISVFALVVVGGLLIITTLQKDQINALARDISKQGAVISGQKNLNEILTIQNQISTLTTLHEQQPAVSNVATYLNQIMPVTASISSLAVDFNANTMVLTGNADSIATINQLVDSLKFAKYSVKGTLGSKNAFSSVILNSYGLTTSGANYTINLSFDPTLFNITDTISLNVPTKVTTRSQLDQPTILFLPSTSANNKIN